MTRKLTLILATFLLISSGKSHSCTELGNAYLRQFHIATGFTLGAIARGEGLKDLELLAPVPAAYKFATDTTVRHCSVYHNFTYQAIGLILGYNADKFTVFPQPGGFVIGYKMTFTGV